MIVKCLCPEGVVLCYVVYEAVMEQGVSKVIWEDPLGCILAHWRNRAGEPGEY